MKTALRLLLEDLAYFMNNSYKRLSHAFAQHIRSANGTYVAKIRPNAVASHPGDYLVQNDPVRNT